MAKLRIFGCADGSFASFEEVEASFQLHSELHFATRPGPRFLHGRLLLSSVVCAPLEERFKFHFFNCDRWLENQGNSPTRSCSTRLSKFDLTGQFWRGRLLFAPPREQSGCILIFRGESFVESIRNENLVAAALEVVEDSLWPLSHLAPIIAKEAQKELKVKIHLWLDSLLETCDLGSFLPLLLTLRKLNPRASLRTEWLEFLGKAKRFSLEHSQLEELWGTWSGSLGKPPENLDLP